jgi:hypothetical protein
VLYLKTERRNGTENVVLLGGAAKVCIKYVGISSGGLALLVDIHVL